MKDLFKGAWDNTKALKIIHKLRLYHYFLVPLVMSILIGSIMVALVFNYSSDFGRLLVEKWTWEFGKSTLNKVSTFIGGAILFLFSLIIFKHLLMAISSPFMGLIIDRVETHLGNKVESRNVNFIQSLMRSILLNTRNLIFELVLVIPFVILSFVPIVGVVFGFLVFLVQAYYAGFGNFDFTLEKYFNYNQSLIFVKKNRLLTIGNGAVFMIILMIPFIGMALALPISTVAAVISVHRKL
ncbi:EI24 domain-containing protein [Aureibacter tunicatorum]|uniref:CysZ protein n=1 Tax=Aureibacter tunicatorum TaxID=866807 RepID=A0AAE4BU88_9BACT|nr:EI24 domain-containing protein [Aureibacter tunicatorum]MDR6240790.1 CysZ protein [Aureibacter tunicatorum]BDD06877.1 hypothetical protein AUTU_43600 [Aureibacter tunicatorum]